MIYIEVIETNLIIDENNMIRDHQSRIVEADSDEMHLSCNITKLKDNGEEIFTNKRLAYRIANPT